MYLQGCPIDYDLVLWVEQQIDLLEQVSPMLLTSFNTSKNDGC
jgi:hypothetical protein